MSVPYAEVIGDPIAHSKSPVIHQFWLEKLGIAAEYRATHVKPGELNGYFGARRQDPHWQGCNVTVPHKQAVLNLVDRVDDVAAVVGAINTIKNFGEAIGGTNTDCDGFSEPLRGLELEGRRAVIVGAGGAARAVYLALHTMGIETVGIANRNSGRAAEMIESMRIPTPATGVRVLSLADPVPEADLVVNATTLGMVGQPDLSLDLSNLPQHAIVYDLVYAPLETGLLQAARANGLATVDGLEMLVGQAALAFEIFFGAPAPRAHDAELRELLTR